MLFKSALVTVASGSIGGMTASRNKGGNYLRMRKDPCNPNTPFQQAVRAAVASLVNAWTDTLTNSQRAHWATYAQNVLLLNRIGEYRNVSALAHYVRSNTPRLQAGLTQVNDGPTIFNLATFTNVSMTISEATQLASVAFTNTDDWAGEVGGAMCVFLSRPQNQTVNSFKGPYRYASKIAGAVMPPTSPQTFAVPFPVVEDQKVFGRVIVTRADGRLSTPFRFSGLVAA